MLDVGALRAPDVATVDMLARMELSARRFGWRLRLRNAGPALRELLRLCAVELPVDGPREAEQGEETGVDEEVDGADRPA